MRKTGTLVAMMACVMIGTAPTAWGHVEMDQPNGGEALEVGSSYVISWHVAIEHNLENWDLWYSTTGPDGPWMAIALDLPPGDPAAGSVHTYEWLIPPSVSEQVRVRVDQDNAGQDYTDHSDEDLAIVPPCTGDTDQDGNVNAADLAFLLGSWGPCLPPGQCPADLNEDGEIDPFDLALLLAAWGPCDTAE